MKIYSVLMLNLLMILLVPSYQVNAANTIILKYGFLRASISVAELSTFAETGKMSSSLRNYFDLANQNPESVRNILIDKIPVDGVLLSKILNSLPGEFLLDTLSNYIKTPSDRASKESLRGALVTSALPDNNIQLIEVLENYPTSEIQVEGDRLLEMYKRIEEVIEKIPFI